MTNLQQVKILTITDRHHDQRLDNFLLSQLKGVPKSRIYKLLRSGQVRVNKGRKKPNYRVQLDDQVRIPPIHMETKSSAEAPAYLLDKLKHSLLFEDEHLLVLNKPAGLAVHSGSNIPFGVIEILRQLRANTDLELVHRLDRDTSGCLIIAKSRLALNELHALFRQDDSLQKTYRCILAGRWQGGEKIIDAPLLKNTLQGGERMVMVDEQGKSAKSLFSPLDYYPDATLAEVTLFTGRTHQIRVHAAHQQHPVAGDKKYGDDAFNKRIKKLGFKRMYLHAYQLRFTLNKQDYNITAPLDKDWQDLQEKLNHEK